MSTETSEKGSVELSGLLMLLWLRKWAFLAVVFIGLLLAVILLTFVPSLYTGRTLILIEASQGDSSHYLNEIEVLRSRTMAKRVVVRLNLMSDPEFNARFEYKESTGEQGFKKLSVYGSELEMLPGDVTDKEIEAVVSRFLKMLGVRSIDDSNVIEIEFLSDSANKAALITNSIADLYLEGRFDEKFQGIQELSGALDIRLSELRENVRVAEQAVVEYRQEHSIESEGGDVSSRDEHSELSDQLAAAREKYAAAKARLNRLRKHKDRAALAPEVVNSPLIQNLKRQKGELEGKLSKLSIRYGDKHPTIINTKAELEELRSSVVSEQRKILSAVENEVKFFAARVRALEEELAEAKEKSNLDKDVMVQLNVLMREAQSAQLVFDAFLETYQRSDFPEATEEAKVRVLSYAVSPSKPSYPNKFLWWGVSIVLSLLAALGVVALLEKLDNSLRSASQLEKMFGYSCYALIPQMEISLQKELADYIVSKPSSALAESLRTLRTAINLRGGEGGARKPKVVTVTSSLPEEGKTVLSVWLGRLAAKSNEKVIVIDADLRRPNVHHCVGKDNDVTLVDYLTEQKELEDVIQKTDVSGVHMIYGRSVPNSALDLVSSDKMAKLVETLSKAYDFVVIDSPACLAVSDARVLANISDHTVYAVEWESTSRDVVASGVKQFTEMDYTDMSFVLTNVDMNRYTKFYGQYKEYYNN